MVEVAERPGTDDLERRARDGDIRAQLEIADVLDSEGRHSDAIDWLARAAGRDDAEALTRLGVKLISGVNAPLLPAQGAGLLQDAVRLGGAKAAAMIALVAGSGALGRQDWNAALDHLQMAAERGWNEARFELAILGDDMDALEELRAGRPLAAGSWGRLRQAVDVVAWTTPPAPEVLVDEPLVRRFAGFASPQACDWLMQLAASRLVRAAVYDHATGAATLDDCRSNSTANFSLFDTSLVLLLLQARLASAIGAPMAMLEAANVLHYAVGEKFDEHYDFIDPLSPSHGRLVAEGGQRVATCIIYLNDDYEGGETEFTVLGLSNKGVRGDAVVFLSALPDGTPDRRSAHAGRPPTNGEKWIVVNFIRDKPQLPIRR